MKEAKQTWFSNKHKVALGLFLFVIGFTFGQYFETKDRASVFVINEARLLKLVSVGLALQDKDSKKQGLSLQDRRLVRSTMKNLSTHLNKYSKRPVAIKKKGNKYELYRNVRKIDITQDLIIKLIGKERWKEIGEEFS